MPPPPSKMELVLGLAVTAAAGAVALEFGFDVPPIAPFVLHVIQVAAAALYLVGRILEIERAGRRWAVARKYLVDGLVFVALIAALGLGARWAVVLPAATAYVVLRRAGAILVSGMRMLYGQPALPSARLHPARLMLTSFLILIFIGGLLLSLPKAQSVGKRAESGEPVAMRVLNCFFTATSAACVTGLVVYDTESDFSRFGQIVILVLMQTGGLGIMVFGSIFGLMLRRQLSLRESLALQDVYSYQTLGEIGSMVKFICITTLAIEACGALLLYDMWPAEITGTATRWFYSIFHAVSAFCNAGFTLSEDSLMPYRALGPTYGVIMPAIVLGGLGFPVLADLGGLARDRVLLPALRRIGFRGGQTEPAARIARLNLHSKLVLIMAAVLIVVPAGLFFLFESTGGNGTSGAAMHSMPWPERLTAALFQSVTCRTAGFNTASLAIDDISTSSLFLMCILMFIGGGPASTAGGVKTVAIAMLVLGTLATLRKRENVEAFHRQIPASTIRHAAVVIMVMFCLVSMVVLLLSYTESASLAEVLFESVSACGTVGLSTGLTPDLTIAGKLVIMLAMFAGRLGPLTLLIALAGRERTSAYSYPVEPITIG
ncbi:MAG: Trk family potassium uptake protein [Planctomycetota bacterium]|nr:Trk family potassium uptake protein [Planctomycetota bacterium]